MDNNAFRTDIQPNPAHPGPAPAAYPQAGQPQQGQIQYAQQQYSQQQYGQPHYAPTGVMNVVTVSQPTTTQVYNYWMPEGKVPGILAIVIGALDFVFFIGLANTGFFLDYNAFWTTAGFYLITGILAIEAATRKQQNSPNIVVACLIFACFSLAMSFVQLGFAALVISVLGYYARWVPPQLPLSIIILVLSLVGFVAMIVLVVVTSRKVCSCCRPHHEMSPRYVHGQPNVGHP